MRRIPLALDAMALRRCAGILAALALPALAWGGVPAPAVGAPDTGGTRDDASCSTAGVHGGQCLLCALAGEGGTGV